MPQANATVTLGLQILKHISVRHGGDQDFGLFLFWLYSLPCDIRSKPNLGSLELSLKVDGIPRIVSVDMSAECMRETEKEGIRRDCESTEHPTASSLQSTS